MLYFLFHYHRNLNKIEKNSFIFDRAIRLFLSIIAIVIMATYMTLLKIVSCFMRIDLYSVYVFLPIFFLTILIVVRIGSKANMKRKFRVVLSKYNKYMLEKNR